jgi:cellulase/cellobiase CelA1
MNTSRKEISMFHPHSSIPSKQSPFGLALLSSTAIVLLLLLTGQPGFAQSHPANPFVGATQYVSPDYTNEVSTAVAQQPAGSTLANQMTVVGNYPTFVWMDHIAAITGGVANNGRLGLADHITAALKQQAATSQPIVVGIVIYDLPDRDCAALASNGELSIAGGDTVTGPTGSPETLTGTGIEEYENDYITPIANILEAQATNPNIRFVLVVEDDSLPNLITNTGESPNPAIANCVAANGGVTGSPSLTGVYVQAITYALNTFHAIPNVWNYLDVGHHGWLGWPDNFAAAVPFLTSVAAQTSAGLASVDGFITNTANYGPTNEPFMTATESIGGNPVNSATFYQFDTYIDEETYASALDAAFIAQGFPSTLGFLIDTSRNGWGGPNRPTGPSTSTDVNTFVNATKIDERDDMGQWCNQTNSGLGVPPTVNPGGFANLSAYVWVKPPGESDGNYPGSTYGGTTSTTGDPNCDPSHDNALANNMPTDALANSPKAGTFWIEEFTDLVQNAFPAISSNTGPGFTLSATGATVMQGTTGTSSVTVNVLGGFSGAVSLAVSGLPAGVTASFSPTSVTGSAGSTLTFTASNTATVGAATVMVTGTSGSTTESTTLTLNVTAEPNFSLSASPTSLTVAPGTQGTSTLTITCVGGLTGSVSLSASNLPSGAQANFSPSSVNCPGGTASVAFFVQNGTASSTSPVTITASNGTITSTATITLIIGTGGTPGFTLSASPASLSIAQGASGSSTITVTPSGGFTGSVSLATSTLPSGVTATFGTNPATSTSVLTFAASSSAATGTSTITITGTSGSLTETATISLTITTAGTPNFTLAASPASLSIAQGASGSSTITVTPSGGFTGSVTLAASTLPSGVTATFGTNPATSTSVVTFAASSSAATGTSTVTITGTSGSLTHTATIALTINASGGSVTVTPVVSSNSPYFVEEDLQLANTAAVTALSVTINVAVTPGISFSGQYNTVGGSITQGESSTSSTITYTFTLGAGQTLSAGSYVFAAQMSGTGTAHPTTGDTYSVTYTTGGTTTTQTGVF